MKKKLSILVIALIGLFVFIFLGIRTFGNKKIEIVQTTEWELIRDINTPEIMRMAAFLDDDLGVIGGRFGLGKTRLTSDGGKTWDLKEQSGGCIFGIEIVDKETIWVAGRKTGKSFTTPGGIRLLNGWSGKWENSTLMEFQPDRTPLSFIDKKTGWAALPNENKLFQTTDGGKTSQLIPLPDEMSQPGSVQILDKNKGFVLDDQLILHFTEDGGKHWINRKIDMGTLKVYKVSGVSSAIKFEDKNKGIVVISLKDATNSKVYILTTENGGKKWKREILCDVGGSVFISPDSRYITINNEKEWNVRVYKKEVPGE